MIKINSFNGEQPSVSPLLLKDTFAEIAVNCDFSRGMLEAMRGIGRVKSLPGAGSKPYVFRTIFKHETEGWLYWDDEVHVCKSDLIDEDEDSAYGALYLTDWITETFGEIPLQRLRGNKVYKLGIPRPTEALTATSQAASDDSSGGGKENESDSGGSSGGSDSGGGSGGSGGDSGGSGDSGGGSSDDGGDEDEETISVPYITGYETVHLSQGDRVTLYNNTGSYGMLNSSGKLMSYTFIASEDTDVEVPQFEWEDMPISEAMSLGIISSTKSANSLSLKKSLGTLTTLNSTVTSTTTTTTTTTSSSSYRSSSGVQRSCAYVYTFVRKLVDGVIEQESATSPPSNVVDVKDGQCVTLTGFYVTPDYNITHVRIYRSVSGTIMGSSSVEYQFVAELEATADMSYEDCARDDELTGELCRTMNWDMIPDNAHGLIKTDNGIYACFRGNEVMFSPHFIPYAFPEAYRINVENDVVALAHTDEAIVILTTGRPYLAVGSEPESLQIIRVPVDQSCVSAQGVVMVSGGVIYPSPDGLVFLTTNKHELLTASVFTREQWQDLAFPWLLDALTDETWEEDGQQVNKYQQQLSMLKPKHILAAWHDEKYYAFFRGTPIGFVFDPKAKSIVWIKLVKYSEVYGVTNNVEDDCIYLSVRFKNYNNICKLNAGTRLKYQWKSKRFNTGRLVRVNTVQTTSEYDYDYDDDQLMKDQADYCNEIGYVADDGSVGAGEWNADRVLKYMCIDKGLTIDEWYRRYGTIPKVKQSYTVNVYAGQCSGEDTPKCTLKVKEDKSRRIPLHRSERMFSIEIIGRVPIHEIRLGASIQETEGGR